MSATLPERRMIENEVVFRNFNEKIQKGFDELKRMAVEDGEDYEYETDEPLRFYCECSDENCRERITLRPSRYNEIHRQRNRFVIVCGHEVEDIEHELNKEDGYCIVEKSNVPSQTETKLRTTDVDNV